MKKASWLLMVVMLALIVCRPVYAAGISDAEVAAMFPGGRVEKNATLNVPGQGYFGAEIFVRIPYKEKISGAELEYDLDFKIRRQILDFNREQSESIVKENLALFAKGSYLYGGGPLEFDEAGSSSGVITLTNIVATTTVDPPQKAAPFQLCYKLTQIPERQKNSSSLLAQNETHNKVSRLIQKDQRNRNHRLRNDIRRR